MLGPSVPEPRKNRLLVANALFFTGMLILVPAGLCAGITALAFSSGFFIFAPLALVGSALVYAAHKLVTRD